MPSMKLTVDEVVSSHTLPSGAIEIDVRLSQDQFNAIDTDAYNPREHLATVGEYIDTYGADDATFALIRATVVGGLTTVITDATPPEVISDVLGTLTGDIPNVERYQDGFTVDCHSMAADARIHAALLLLGCTVTERIYRGADEPLAIRFKV